MTPLVVIAGWYSRAIGLYDLGPAYLFDGQRRYAFKQFKRLSRGRTFPDDRDTRDAFAAGWAKARYRSSFLEFFSEVVDILAGRPSLRVPAGRLLQGRLPASKKIRITGGNLSLVAALVGSKYVETIDPTGKWLALEDLDETEGQLDRMLATLKLACFFEKCDGVLLGDFHSGDEEQTDSVIEMMKHHLPARRRVPIVRLDNFGHVWPLAPLPLHREVTLRCRAAKKGLKAVTIDIPWAGWGR
jgi:muramoyltetrapeptide carboxypeptidase LdcA involved in peptidoglycan recycling